MAVAKPKPALECGDLSAISSQADSWKTSPPFDKLFSFQKATSGDKEGHLPVLEDLTSLTPKTEYTRREFVVTTLATGFALAVQPVSAQTITTDTSGLVAGEVKIPVSGGEIPAYR